MLNSHKPAMPLVFAVPLIYFAINFSAFAQTSPNFDDLFDGLDDAMTQSDDPTVYDSLDAAVNPRVAEICGYIENGKRDLLEDVLLDDQHNFLKKQYGDYHSFVDFFSIFKCPQMSYGGLSSGGAYSDQYTPLELSILHSNGPGFQIVSRMIEKIISMPKKDMYAILSSENSHGETILSFTERLIYIYSQELKIEGKRVGSNDLTLNQLINIRDRLIKIEHQTNQELRITENR